MNALALCPSPPLTQEGLHGAFVAEGFGIAPEDQVRTGPLTGVRLAVKDVLAVRGQRLGAGNPIFLAGQEPAGASALAVEALLRAGASWVGKTVTDELAFSLTGVNAHYGGPINPAWPDRIAGGSSSGSAVAVAAGHADLAIGTDCGGSMRLPASYCGIWGIRPTQGRIPAGGFSLAHSFDTVGWFARSGELLSQALAVTTHARPAECAAPAELRVPLDALGACDAAIVEAFQALLSGLDKRLAVIQLPVGSFDLDECARVHRTLQAAEIWQQHGAWVEAHPGALATDIAERFRVASTVSPAEVAAALPLRVEASHSLVAALPRPDSLLIMPTVPTAPPRRDAARADLEAVRNRAQRLLSLAGLAGLPQVSLPWIETEEGPVGLSIIGHRGADEIVLGAAMWLAPLARNSSNG